MAMSVVYSNFCGMVVSETRGGVESDYVHDTLGSTIGLMDNTGTMTDRWEYWPFGEAVSHAGTNPTPLTFLGVLGYFKDVLDKLFYVRARHLRVDLAKWLSVDSLWPAELPYGYVANAPTMRTDPSGRGCCPPPTPDHGCNYCMNNANTAKEVCLIAAAIIVAQNLSTCLAACTAGTGGLGGPVCVWTCWIMAGLLLAALALICWLIYQWMERRCVVGQCDGVMTKCCKSLS